MYLENCDSLSYHKSQITTEAELNKDLYLGAASSMKLDTI